MNRGVPGDASHKFNAIRHGPETAEIGLSPETAEIVCNALTSAHPMSFDKYCHKAYYNASSRFLAILMLT